MQQAERQAWAMHDPGRITREQQAFQTRVGAVGSVADAMAAAREITTALKDRLGGSRGA